MALTGISVEGSTLTVSTGPARNVKLLAYGQGAKRGKNFTIPYRDGAWSGEKWFGPTDVTLEIYLRGTPSPEANLSTILGLFHQTYNTATLQATHAYAGSVRAEVELLKDPRPVARNPRLYVFSLRNPKGVWESVTATTSTGTSISPAAPAVTGDKPVDDFSVLFASSGYVEHTSATGKVARMTIATGAPANITVDLGARTILTSTGGNADAYFTPTQPFWMRFEANSTASLTASMNHTFTWRSKWAV